MDYSFNRNGVLLDINKNKCMVDDKLKLKYIKLIHTDLKNKFVITHSQMVAGKNRIKKHNLYKVIINNDDRILLLFPFELGMQYLNIIEYPIYSDTNNDSNIFTGINNLNITLFDNQTKICNYLENELLTKYKTIFVAKPGSGKTVIGLYIMYMLGKKTLIVLPNIYLLNQWKRSIVDIFGTDIENDILIWNGNSGKKNLTIYNPNFKIILCTVQTSLNIEYDKHLPNVDFVIYDEIHMYCTKCYSETFWLTQTKYVLGLTATPNKLDGFEQIYFSHFGQPIKDEDILDDIELKALKKTFNTELKALMLNTHIPLFINDKTGIVDFSKMIDEIIHNQKRNNIIINEIINIYDKQSDNFIYVFSDRIEHLLLLSEMLKNIRDDIKLMIGGSSEEVVLDCINNARVIFTTYQYSSTGVNIVKMNNLILATPRKSNIIQIVGRIHRSSLSETNNLKLRTIIDIVDGNSIFVNQFRFRMKDYKLNHFNIIKEHKILPSS